MRRRRKGKRFPWLFIAAGAVFAGAVLWQVLPKGGLGKDSASHLRTRLTLEREQRKRELERELESLREENRELQAEINELRERPIE